MFFKLGADRKQTAPNNEFVSRQNFHRQRSRPLISSSHPKLKLFKFMSAQCLHEYGEAHLMGESLLKEEKVQDKYDCTHRVG